MLHDPIDPRDLDPSPSETYDRYSVKTLWVSVVECANPRCNSVSRVWADTDTCPVCGSDANEVEATNISVQLNQETGETYVI